MSRGGRGGRGGRFGGNRGPGSDLISANLEDMGLESINAFSFNYDENSPPPIYPAIELNPPPPLQEEDNFLIAQSRSIRDRSKVSPYYSSRNIETQKNVVKYSDIRKRSLVGNVSLTDTVVQNKGLTIEDAIKHVPYELLDKSTTGLYRNTKLKGSKKGNGNLPDLENFEAEEGKRGKDAKATDKDGDSGGESEGMENDEEAEWDDDYGVDHYASDDAGGFEDGDDGEATF